MAEDLFDRLQEKREEVEQYREGLKLSKFSPSVFICYLGIFYAPIIASFITMIHIKAFDVLRLNNVNFVFHYCNFLKNCIE